MQKFNLKFIVSFLALLLVLINSNKTYSQNSWNLVSINEQNTIKKVFFVSQTYGYLIAGNNNVYRTSDGGQNWELKNTGVNTIVYSIFFIDINNGWLCGPGSKAYLTTDAGETWTQVSVSTFDLSLKSIYFTDYNTGYIVGQEGYLFKTTNGGSSWSSYNSSTTNQLNDVFFVNSNNGFAVGEFGTIVKTTNGGENWSTCENVPYGMFNKISFPDQNTGYVCASTGTIIKTDDGGNTWYEQNITGNYTFNSLYFINSNTGFAVADFGKILKTFDGGQNWEKDSIEGVTSHFYDVFFIDENIGFIGGDGGLLYKTNSSGNIPYLYLSATNLTLYRWQNSFSDFDIDANTTWSVYEDTEWLYTDKVSGANNSTITVWADENFSENSRQAFIYIFGGNLNYQVVVVTQDGTAAINENKQNKVICYPNPASDVLTFVEPGNYKIFNNLNVLVLEFKNNEKVVDISNLNSGVYFIKSSNGIIQKLIINSKRK